MFISLIHPCIHRTSISLNTYYVLGMLLGAGNTIEEKNKQILAPKELTISCGTQREPGNQDTGDSAVEGEIRGDIDQG